MTDEQAQIRCINIDWLEIFCVEPLQPRDANYFELLGYGVKKRPYGTPQYAEMLTLIDEGHRFLEIRRLPISLRRNGGIFEDGACHIRLTNRSCYLRNPVRLIAEFIVANGYTYKSISRIDLALDFTEFDDGTDPQQFVDRYMRGEIQKINQCRLAAHGSDGWGAREWNSLKWGAPTSAVTTKLYDKTKELKQAKDKPYIREVWQACGLSAGKHVWRVEFSLSSQLNALVSKEEQYIVTRSLDAYDGKDRLFFQFCVLAQKYFHFKLFELTRSGKPRQKDRCADVRLFNFDGRAKYYEPKHLIWEPAPERIEQMLAKRLLQIARDQSINPLVRRAAELLEIHMCDRYDVLDYTKQLLHTVEWEHSGIEDTKADLKILKDMCDRYAPEDFNKPNLARKLKYYIV